ncbi:cell cycle control protein 50C-like [Myxocyprinus asiaticus]|uniref:cell cycle control protein 50C-like n=1 Tax=Myxocyprinus asiaticus TaxID=70543 RepID=UPI0022238034|nr:cell cycle control protein 50C-like [Myxocyprinus asiaticus]
MGKKQAGTGPFLRRPDNSAFKQQRLPAWSPSLTAQTVLPSFYILSLVCLLLGIWLLITVENTHQLKVDYTNGSCAQCFEMRKNASNAKTNCKCSVPFFIEKKILGDVFIYYGLVNFHQNLRRYMDSRDDAQMVGRKTNLKSSYCTPFDYDANRVPIAPCGAVANSMFNDSFILYYKNNGSTVQVPLFRKGIAWYTDKNVKFRNPPTNETFTLQQAFEGTTLPFFWQRPVYELDTTDPNNNGFINDDLIVWMREAAFPNFKKLYGVLNRAQWPFTDGLPAGNYNIAINYNFPVGPFRGQKEVVISTVTWFGGQNHFLPIAYLVTSGLILVAAIGLTTVYVKVGKKGKNLEE